MTIVGFHFTKINAEKKDGSKGKININNNVSIEKVEEKDLSLTKAKQKVLSVAFKFTTDYRPSLGKIVLDGVILYLDDDEAIKKILEDWKKDKKLPKEIMTKMLNTILNKCNIEALFLSEHVNLSPPIKLPHVVPDAKK